MFIHDYAGGLLPPVPQSAVVCDTVVGDSPIWCHEPALPAAPFMLFIVGGDGGGPVPSACLEWARRCPTPLVIVVVPVGE